VIIESCGNVFADLGLPDADELLAKAKAGAKTNVFIGKVEKATKEMLVEVLQ